MNSLLTYRYAAAAMILAVIQGCATIGPPPPPPPDPPMNLVRSNVNLPPPYTEHNVTVAIDGLSEDIFGNVSGVSGTATNNGQKNLKACSVYLNIVDASGTKIASAQATTVGLKQREIWRFEATFTTPYSDSFKSIVPGRILAYQEPSS